MNKIKITTKMFWLWHLWNAIQWEKNAPYSILVDNEWLIMCVFAAPDEDPELM
jgi:hypothetical protein